MADLVRLINSDRKYKWDNQDDNFIKIAVYFFSKSKNTNKTKIFYWILTHNKTKVSITKEYYLKYWLLARQMRPIL